MLYGKLEVMDFSIYRVFWVIANIFIGIQNIIEKITPYLNSDGGNIELVKVEDNVVYVKLTGACGCCPHRNETIKYGILESIQAECPEITDVINVDI